MNPELFLEALVLIAAWCIVWYIADRKERAFYILCLVMSLFMVNSLGVLSIIFIGISAYFTFTYLLKL